MSVWGKAIRAMGGTSLLMQEQIDDLRAERDDLKGQLEDLRARYERPDHKFDLRAHMLLRDVLTRIHERACSGDIQEAVHRLWLFLDRPPDADAL